MSLLRQVTAIKAEDRALAIDVKRALVDGLYTPFKSLVVGAVSGAIISGAAALRSGDPSFAFVAAAIVIVGAGRIAVARIYIRNRPAVSRNHETWEFFYAAGGFAFAALLGLCAFLAITRSDDVALQVITASTAIGYGAGISGRNAGRPFLAIGQLLLSSLPLSLGMFVAGDGSHMALGTVIILFAYGMIDITLSIREIVVTALVTTREKAALAESFKAQADLFDIALNNMSHGLCMFDTRGRLKVWNRRFLEISGLDPSRVVVGASARGLFGESQAEIETASGQRRPLLGAFEQANAALAEGSLVVRLPEDRFISLVQRRTAEAEAVVIYEDITERKRDEARINRMARYDELTGLYNRSSFRQQIDEALELARRRSGHFAIHLLDLDRFKAINDTKGHPAGDRLLQLVADRLRTVVNGANSASRIGGDEFVIIQNGVGSPDEAGALAHGIVRLLEEPFEIDGSPVRIGASVGTALAPEHADDGDRLLKCADIALYAAKADGRSTYRIFQQEMEAETQARHAIEMGLRTALANDEFELLYQPLIDLGTGRVARCEALLRWRHPTRGYVSPLEFIHVAEETGLILPIGDWVLNEACREARNWPVEVGVAVNLSPVQFNNPSLSLQVVNALQRSGLPANRLELEVTESVTLDGNEHTLTTIDQLQSLGIHLSLDDFGTGYSSLSYLKKYPFDTLKIDRSFVNELNAAADSVAIIRAVVGMGKSLGMTIVVEGVETEEQLAILKAEGCDLGQGYLFSRPISAGAIRTVMADGSGMIRSAA
ncbi:putative bifunctional diguanylate cyclase/phosphodiesterase [Methylobacterium haplocladii]|uniref:GGDEF-domain containing protein n=1 Tax=Methylobacterium haplocladii TaxID=1176176 RepID=A0A512IMU1_9HYPH|nr:bifunctional diguanylate cyclase/phosphodiesterase [Methylobacterium haplocladii]GEO99001.1 GGDEF-domain containing protein [Methylobacterium haplocladii]GJD84151.1 hypothetical protein HPGCJGGD_2026 [Methylobacterium haplocladii]GLS61213.1 GGDEF-domain containing protein [Methylobacterium haplocladii]